MSNDVHLAKVSKIQRGIPKANTLGHKKETQTTEEKIEANDLSPEHPDNNISDNNISSCSTLDIVNLTQHQLEAQVKELTKNLQDLERGRNSLERKLKDANAEKEVCLRRLEVISTAHECRITEMHCVIAELSKKLRAKQETIIVEEQEPDGSETSYQEGSIYNSELNLTNPECQTEPLDSNGEEEVGGIGYQDEYLNMDLNEQDIKLNENSSKGQIEALQEEVLHLKAQIALLQSELANALQNDREASAIEKEKKHQPKAIEDDDANESNCSSEHLLFVQSDKIPAVIQQQMVNSNERREEMRVPKMAERVKLRCVSNNTIIPVDVPATDLRKENPTTDLMRQLMQQLHQDNNSLGNNVMMDSMECDELRSLQRKVEHLKLQNSVLSLTLDECKEHCEHLYLLCGKYESNSIALQLALNCSDRAIEAYDVMLALLESKLALIKEKSVATDESRKAVESVAQHLLQRLECEKNICENSLGPWQSTFNIPEKTTQTPWTSDDDNRLRYHVSKLKGCRSNVQNTLVSLESPFSDCYEKFRIAALDDNGSELKNQERFAQLDLEMAIVMQDLLELREDNISLKTKIDDLQKERQYNLNRISILEGALNELQLQLNEVDAHKAMFQPQQQRDSTIPFVVGGIGGGGAFENRISYSEAEHSVLIEQQLVEALTRESELKGRIQTLIASVAATQKLSENRELDTNLNMAQLLEQNKRKYQTRIRKLEQKVLELSINSGNNVASCSMKQNDVPETTL